MADVPVFASIGAVNTGKTSTIATLIEDDSLRISRTPGETTRCQRFDVLIDDAPILVFVDTPGFQNAKSALAKLKKFPSPQEDPLQRFRTFVAEFSGDSKFSEECRLFVPIIDGAGIIYVVDASQPFLPINAAEMEILRMTSQPRMGLINCTSHADHKRTWEAQLAQHFNLVREFNAHTAGYSQRIELLKALAGIKQEWRPVLDSAIAALDEDWKRRTDDAAEVISELLVDCISHEETVLLAPGKNEERTRVDLLNKYKTKIRNKERLAHRRVVRAFKHKKATLEDSEELLLTDDLFSDKVWRLLGLNAKQLVWAASLAGAAAGSIVDAASGGHTLGLGTAIGGAIGAGSALVLGKAKPELEARAPGRWGRVLRHKVAGYDLRVTASTALNFPWILLDRSLAVFYYATHRAHARQDRPSMDVEVLVKELKSRNISVETWSQSTRSSCEKIFVRVRKKKIKSDDRHQLRQIIVERLREIGTNHR